MIISGVVSVTPWPPEIIGADSLNSLGHTSSTKLSWGVELSRRFSIAIKVFLKWRL